MDAPTMQDWRTLPAGHEMDVLVAERVMGFEWVTAGGGAATMHDADKMRTHAFRRPDGSFIPGIWLDRYSTDIAAAWQVVEALERRGWYPEVNSMFSPDGLFWRADMLFVLADWDDPSLGALIRGGFCGDADTAPLAICRAALAAVEVR